MEIAVVNFTNRLVSFPESNFGPFSFYFINLVLFSGKFNILAGKFIFSVSQWLCPTPNLIYCYFQYINLIISAPEISFLVDGSLFICEFVLLGHFPVS